MCFTIHIRTTRDAIESRFKTDASALVDFEFRYFYRAFDKPQIPVIASKQQGKVTFAQWGLIPHWTRDQEQAEKISKGTFNARAESVDSKPAFRDAFRHHRCWVIVSGFFEWQHVNREKRPWFISLKEKELFALGGLLSEWTDPDSGEILKTFSILTTKSNRLMSHIHNTKKRMPLILEDDEADYWLNASDPHALKQFMRPFNDDKMNAFTVSKKIGKPDADPFDHSIIEEVKYHDAGKLF